MSIVFRILFLCLSVYGGIALGLALAISTPWQIMGLGGGIVGLVFLLFEQWLRRVPLDLLFWSGLGLVVGLTSGQLLGASLALLAPNLPSVLARGALSLVGGYLGVAVAIAKSEELQGLSLKLFPRSLAGRESLKLLDTSVIIDGRIADLCETGFIEGVLLVPQFVLRELQQIADSSDSLKRNRGRRGLDVLQKMQKAPKVRVEIHELDFPQVREVDRKLIECAKVLGAKVVTNDYNLNKVAELSGVQVLNINELANSLKPVVLTGELMHVHVLREGKESGQGVAYLDDGTMVVVDHGKKYLGQSVDVLVTSVLQTTAGRMIFTRPKEEEYSRSGDER